MNAIAPFERPKPAMLTVDDFLFLKRSGAFAGFTKAELLFGALSGVPRSKDGEAESDMSVPIKLKLEDYNRLAAADLLGRFATTELIDGQVYELSPQHRPHGYARDELAYRMRRCIETHDLPWHVATEQSVAVAPYSQPQPDIILTNEPRGEGPIPISSAALIIEIAVTSLDFDLSDKLVLYAGAGLAEYWVVDLAGKQVHQFWTPGEGEYAESRRLPLGGLLESVTIEKLSVSGTDI